jgi:hypothetical protein
MNKLKISVLSSDLSSRDLHIFGPLQKAIEFAFEEELHGACGMMV